MVRLRADGLWPQLDAVFLKRSFGMIRIAVSILCRKVRYVEKKYLRLNGMGEIV